MYSSLFSAQRKLGRTKQEIKQWKRNEQSHCRRKSHWKQENQKSQQLGKKIIMVRKDYRQLIMIHLLMRIQLTLSNSIFKILRISLRIREGFELLSVFCKAFQADGTIVLFWITERFELLRFQLEIVFNGHPRYLIS